MYVCICHAVTDHDVHAAVASGARSTAEIGERTGAGTGCGTCADRLCAIVDGYAPAHAG